MPTNRNKNDFFSVKALSSMEGEIRVYGEITKWAWEEFGEKSAVMFSNELKKLADCQKINLYINSPGGEVNEALAMYHELKRLGETKEIIAHIDGVAASSASILALAANKIKIGLGCSYMIHNPMLTLYGANAQDMKKAMERLEKTTENMLDIYCTKSKLSRDEVKQKMEDTTWFTAEEAVAAGFADEVVTYDINEVAKNVEAVMMSANNIEIPDFMKELIMSAKNNVNRNQNKPEEEKMTLEEMKAKHGDVLAQYKEEVAKEIVNTKAVQESTTKAIMEERARIADLEKIKTNSEQAKAIVAKAKFEEPRDKRDVIVDLYELQAEQAAAEINKLVQEQANAGFNEITNSEQRNTQETTEDEIINKALEELNIKA